MTGVEIIVLSFLSGGNVGCCMGLQGLGEEMVEVFNWL